ncbi:chemotaxis-specific protein-glutamate methyltransferase CheB [Rubellimicrobium rubrum]|uniref:Protein-glutamate methylesterase/protein-glutamine glutaminase n=1 Tax=Rubellimicrobium rubrum TaxID=2585369 RepID=A0A5C4MKY3_9RHOB|nr:chemotaxis-specific protein-glutamate methyltransferase CheB [Rubellimicrobium rubrum]TNC46230.1 chemotaxis-specific protein-glutamate methyltransferase CheB [Rubellimicrobium rubrum]
MIKLLIVDDSALMRRLLAGLFAAEGDFEVRLARDGEEGLDMARAERPDVMTLDVQMPRMDGLACLDRLMIEAPCPVVMVSAITEKGAEATLEALRLGAVDVVTKPTGAVSLEMDRLGPLIVAKVRAAAGAKLRRSLRLTEVVRHRVGREALSLQRSSRSLLAIRPEPAAAVGRMVLIGTSTGGPPALETVLSQFPADFPCPVLVVQHMPATFTGAMARRLDALCAIEVVEVDAPMPIVPGRAYIGRGDADLLLARRSGGLVALPAPASEKYLWHPSVDRMVDSVLELLPAEQLLGVLMTGMGRDGAEAMTRLRQRGGRTIAESEATAVVWGMPGELVRSGGAEAVVPLDEIAPLILRMVT